MDCPDCGQAMTYKGAARYECKNNACDVIEVEFDQVAGKIRRIKRSSI